MPSTNPKIRSTLRWERRAACAVLLVAGLAIAPPAHAKPGCGHHGCGGSDVWIEHHAEELGIDDATLREIRGITDASREQAEAIHEELREAHEAMRELLDRDAPDEGAVMRQAELMGEIDLRRHKQHLATMLRIRAKLTPEQRRQLREMKHEMHERHHGGHGRLHHRGGEGCPHGKGAPPPSAQSF
jgi:Spy/CpxP family protein refolding chaperone